MHTIQMPGALSSHLHEMIHLPKRKCRENVNGGAYRVYQSQKSYSVTIALHRLWWKCNIRNVHSSLQSQSRRGRITFNWGATSSSEKKWRIPRNTIPGLYLGRTLRIINTQAEMLLLELRQWGANNTKKLMHTVWWYLNDTTMHLPISLTYIKDERRIVYDTPE